MPNEKLLDSAQASHLSSLAGSAMEGLGSTRHLTLGKGCFVEEQVGTLDILHVVGIEAGIAAIDIFAGWSCREREPAIGDYIPLGGHIILSVLDAGYLAEGYPVEVYHLTPDMGGSGFLLEDKTTTGNTVTQRKCLYAYRAILIDDIGAPMGEGVELHIVGHAVTEEIELWTHHLL